MKRGPWSLAAGLTLLAACTSVASHHHSEPELARLRAAGYRVAVLPFAITAPDDGFVAQSLGPVGDLLALEQGRDLPRRDRIAALLHDDVAVWLQQSDYQVVDPWHVATTLAHAGLSSDAIQNRSRAREIAALVGADALLYGEVRRWNRGYYVLQTVVDVALQLELVDGGSGRTLFTSERTETMGSGLTGGPTGYVSAATEPIAGLRGSYLRNLSRSVARHAVADLNGGELGDQPGPTTPRLGVVALARMHDGPFRAGERIDVIAVGSPDCLVRFDLGRLRVGVPMNPIARHDDPRGARATYVGHYVVADGDDAADLPLSCTILRREARRSVALRVRWEGAVSLGSPAIAAGRTP